MGIHAVNQMNKIIQIRSNQITQNGDLNTPDMKSSRKSGKQVDSICPKDWMEDLIHLRMDSLCCGLSITEGDYGGF